MLKEIFSPAEASAFAGAGAESVDEVAGLESGGFGVSDGLLASLQEARKSNGTTVGKRIFFNMQRLLRIEVSKTLNRVICHQVYLQSSECKGLAYDFS